MTNQIIQSFDIFLSYRVESSATNRIQINKLNKRLTEEFYFKVWYDLEQIKLAENLSKQIAEGIKNSKIVLCCVTKLYSQSNINQSELEIAFELHKPLVVIMLEDLKLIDVPEISIRIANQKRCNLFTEVRGLKTWSGKLFDEVIQRIKQLLDVNDKKNLNRIQNEKKMALFVKPQLQTNELTLVVNLPKSARITVKKCLDFMKSNSFEKISDEIDHWSLVMHSNDLNPYIDAVIKDNLNNASQQDKRNLIEIKTLNSNEQRIFHLEKIDNFTHSKFILFIFKRKSNGRFQVFSCSTKRFHDLTRFSQIIKALFLFENNQQTNDYLKDLEIQVTKTIAKTFLLSYLIDEMNEFYDQNIVINWDYEFRFYQDDILNTDKVPKSKPCSQVIASQNDNKPIVTNTDNSIDKKLSNSLPIIIKLPVFSKNVILKCKELSDIVKIKIESVNSTVKFEKFVIETHNIENFLNVILAKYPHVTDDEKRSMFKLKALNSNESKSLFLETHNMESMLKITLFAVRFDVNRRLKILLAETKQYLRIHDLTEIFSYFYKLNETQENFEIIQELENLESNKKIHKCLIKFFLSEYLRMNFNETFEIQWDQFISNNENIVTSQQANDNRNSKETTQNENQIIHNSAVILAPPATCTIPNTDRQSAHENANRHLITTIKENHRNLETVKEPPIGLILPTKGKAFLENCQEFIKTTMNLKCNYEQYQLKSFDIKPRLIERYIDKLLDEYLHVEENEKNAIRDIKNMQINETRAIFIETNRLNLAKFIIFVCIRSAPSGKYQLHTIEDLKYHDLTEFKSTFLSLYDTSNVSKDDLKCFFDSLNSEATKSNIKILILNCLIEKLNENIKERVCIEWKDYDY